MPETEPLPTPPPHKKRVYSRAFGAVASVFLLSAMVWELVVSCQTGGWPSLWSAPFWILVPLLIFGFLWMIAWAIEGRPESQTPAQSAGKDAPPEARPELSSRATTWLAWTFLWSGVLLLLGATIYRLVAGATADVFLTGGGVLLGVLLAVFGLGIAADRRVKDRGGKAGPNAKG